MCEICIRTCNAIGELISEEADSVTILAANPDFIGPDYAIECGGDWTSFNSIRFSGKSIVECLESAVEARRAQND